MAQLFFSAEAQAALAARGEPPPKWAYMADDDSFAFTSELLAELGKRDPDGKHYLGYAFLAAPHLEGVIPGKRQPTFGNGGAGIAVSRGAMGGSPCSTRASRRTSGTGRATRASRSASSTPA